MTILVTLLHIILIFFLAYQVWRRQKALRKYFWPGLGVKLIAGIFLGLIYTHYYSVADTFAYFEDGKSLAALAIGDFSSYVRVVVFNEVPPGLTLINAEPRAFFLTKITSVFNVLTVNNYWVIGAYYSFFSFLGAWFLVTTINRHIPAVSSAALIAFIFLPSVVFWSSGLLKESLAMPCLYFLTAVFLKVWFQERLSLGSYLPGVVCLWVLWQLKYYYVAVFLPVALTTLAYRFIIGRKPAFPPARELLVWAGIFLLPVILISFLHPNFYPGRLLEVILVNNAAFNELSDPRDVIHFNDLEASPLSMLKNMPWALFSGLFRPLIWETSAVIQILPSIENTLILILFVVSCFRLNRYRVATHRLLILAGVVYVTLLCILITISAPNFGTLSRYRIGYISFFVLLILCDSPVIRYIERSIRRLVSH